LATSRTFSYDVPTFHKLPLAVSLLLEREESQEGFLISNIKLTDVQNQQFLSNSAKNNLPTAARMARAHQSKPRAGFSKKTLLFL